MNQSNSPSLRVQSVLYGNEFESMLRACEAAVNSLTHASHLIGQWAIAYGDSSPEPIMSDSQIDTCRAIVEEAGGTFEYQFFDANLGHGGGHNRLHESSVQDLLLILNPDGLLAPNCVERLLLAMKPNTGVIDARQLPMEHPKDYHPQTHEASWSSLACALTPSAVFREVGGIDHETFFMYCDDVDYSWRVRLAGYSAQYCPQARMFHDKRLQANGDLIASETERYYSIEAAMMLAYKYSRDDVLDQLLSTAQLSQNEYFARALVAFNRRRNSGTLPDRIDPGNIVADFTKGHYGEHRF